MNKKTILLIVAIGLFGAAWHFSMPQKTWSILKDSNISNKIKESAIKNSEFLPGPLRGNNSANNSVLTLSGVIEATNQQRGINGQVPLRRNLKLNKAAQAKLEDMFKQQYFEHNSPQGFTPADVIKSASYEYIVVGENLALGNFENDQLLVEAWMNSPGHRANILHPNFFEIGVAVGKGMFEGKQVWLAVQEFGTPLSKCPGPAAYKQKQIDDNRLQIDVWQNELIRRKSQLESSRYATEDEYNQAVDAYNALAAKANALIETTRDIVEQYNAEVNQFNKCLEQNA